MTVPTRMSGSRARRNGGSDYEGLSYSVTRLRPGVSASEFSTHLTGFEEVPAILSGASGAFTARVSSGGNTLQYELNYANLASTATAAHIHFAQRGVSGPIIVFLCGGNGTGNCPERAGTVRGTISSEDIRAIPEQGLEAGDFEGFLRILRAGAAYVNVHSERYPNGEIRGQIRARVQP